MISLGAPPILFQGRSNANQTIATAATYTPIALQAEDFDDANGHSNTVNNSRYVIQRTGVYRLNGTCTWNTGGTTGTLRVLVIRLNGTANILGNVAWANYSGGFQTYITPPVDVPLTAGDYIELTAYSNSANQVLYGDTSTTCSMLRAELIR